MNNRISVIIPLYNQEELVIEALSSIEKQTLLPVEVIVVDDKSTDNSFKAAAAFAKTSALKITVIENKHRKGPSGAINYGISLAQGEYIAILDSDDLWAPAHLDQLHQALEEERTADIAFSQIEVFGEARDMAQIAGAFASSVAKCLEGGFEPKADHKWLSTDNLTRTLLIQGFPFRCQASLIRKDFFAGRRLYFDEDILFCQDAQFIIMASYWTKFIYIGLTGLKWRRHAGNEGDCQHQNIIAASFSRRVIKLKKYFSDKNLRKDERKALWDYLGRVQREAIRLHLIQGKNCRAFYEILKGICLFPGFSNIKATAGVVLKRS